MNQHRERDFESGIQRRRLQYKSQARGHHRKTSSLLDCLLSEVVGRKRNYTRVREDDTRRRRKHKISLTRIHKKSEESIAHERHGEDIGVTCCVVVGQSSKAVSKAVSSPTSETDRTLLPLMTQKF